MTPEDAALLHLLPFALQIMREEYGWHHVGAHDTLEAEGALYSAFQSFQGRYRSGQFSECETPQELALAFLTIAHNRWRRSQRRDRAVCRGLERGRVPDHLGQRVQFDPPDPGELPDEEVARTDSLAYFRLAIGQVLAALSPSGQDIVAIYLEDMTRTQDDIAKRAGRHQATVSRHLGRFYDQLRQLWQEIEP